MYQRPESNSYHQEYWSQYPDESEDAHQWLNHFKRPNDISNGDDIKVALIEAENSNDDADNPFVLYSPHHKGSQSQDHLKLRNLIFLI